MNEEIKLLIEKNLPHQVGEVLKEHLIKAEKDAQELLQAKKIVEDYSI